MIALKAAFNPDQPRVPAGHPGGGQWTDGDDGVIPVADNDRPGNDRYLNPHILQDHVGKTDAELVERLKALRSRVLIYDVITDRNGSFTSGESARDFIIRTIDMNHETVERVARGQLPGAFLTWRFGGGTGREAILIQHDPEIIRVRKTYEVGVYIVYEPNSEFGYRVRTAYPRNYNPRLGR